MLAQLVHCRFADATRAWLINLFFRSTDQLDARVGEKFAAERRHRMAGRARLRYDLQSMVACRAVHLMPN